MFRGKVFVVMLLSLVSMCSSQQHPCHFRRTDRFLNCSARGLTTVPTNHTHFNDARGIDLSFNIISAIENRTFANVTGLQCLDLSDNIIDTMKPAAFHGLWDLFYLNLSGNLFSLSSEILTPELFEPLVSLRVIEIQRYKSSENRTWEGIDKAFGKLRELRTLVMGFPRDFIFGPGFEQMTKLTAIHAFGRPRVNKDCLLGTLRNTTFEVFRNVALAELRLIHCNVDSIEANVFEPLTSLTTLDLTYNENLGLRSALKALYGLRGRNMTAIKFQHLNNFSCEYSSNFILSQSDFTHLKTICVKHVDMSQNSISVIDDSVEPKFRLDCLQKLNVSFHSLRCIPWKFLLSMASARQLTVWDISHGFGVPNYGAYMAPDTSIYTNQKCEAAQHKYPMVVLPPNLRVVDVTAMAIWFYIDKDLVFVNGLNLITVRAGYNRLDNCADARILGMENVTHLDISGVVCDGLHSNYFLHFRKLVKLSLSYSPKMYVALMADTCPFALLESLEEVDLTGNKLTGLHPQLFRNNTKLRSINLSNNKLQHFPTALAHITGLQRLDLSYNALSSLLPNDMKLMDRWVAGRGDSKPFQLLLENNPLQCTCDTVLFIRWILQRKQYLDQNGNYTCLLSDGTRIALLNFGDDLTTFEVRCVSHTYLIISVVGSLALLVLILLFAVVYRYRVNLRYWLYTRLQPPENMFAEHPHVYDAFVAYASGDYQWVFRVLRKQLELTEDPVTLCLHERDFIPGKPIHENIVDKMRESKKILLVVSRAFLESTYGPLEIEYAGMKSLEEGRDDVIVCVLFEDLPAGEMPRPLRNLWHKITFLKWHSRQGEDGVFWDRLKEALL